MHRIEFKPESLNVVLVSTTKSSGAEFTAVSRRTNKEYTFKIARKEYPTGWFTLVSVETGYLNFKYLGVYKNGQITYKGKPVTSDSAIAIAWILRKAEQRDVALDQVHFYHLGKCIKCGRTLTDSTSIEIGLGPKCRS